MTAPAVERRSAYTLTPKQGVAMDAIWVDGCNQVLYGGAAGGGKSGFIRALAYHCANVWPGARVAVFRTDYTQLKKTQVVRWHVEMTQLGWDVKRQWRETAAEWHFPNPYATHPDSPAEDTIVEFLHLDQSIGAEKWLSAEWAAIFIDESTQMTEDDLSLLYSRVRVTEQQQALWRRLADEREARAREAGIASPSDIARIRSDYRPLAVYATNPGGASHEYHVREFIEPSRANDAQAFDKTERLYIPGLGEQDVTTRRKFVQSFLTDNPHINAMEYAATLAHLPRRRREQMLSGDWDYFEGKVFADLDPEIHLIDAKWVFGRNGVPPEDWPRLGGLDHGTQAPTAAIWETRDDDGFFIVGYLEYYSPGPNKQHIQAMRALMMHDGRYDIQFEADPQMWRKRQGHDRVWSVADEFTFGGEPPEDPRDAAVARQNGIRLRQATVDRLAARMALERMFEPDPDRIFPDWHPKAGQHGAPRAFICKQAPNLWRELNLLKYVDGSEETVKENDHAYDAAYRVMTAFEQAVYGARLQRRVTQIGYAG